MRFENAVIAMKSGQKVRLKSWTPEKYVKATGHFFVEYVGDCLVTTDAKFAVDEIVSDEWELFEKVEEEELTPEKAVNSLICLRTALGLEIPPTSLVTTYKDDFVKAITFAIGEIRKRYRGE